MRKVKFPFKLLACVIHTTYSIYYYTVPGKKRRLIISIFVSEPYQKKTWSTHLSSVSFLFTAGSNTAVRGRCVGVADLATWSRP